MESFDLRDTIVPISLLKISNHFRKMNPGEILEVICSDPDLVEDLNCLLHEPDDAFVQLEKIDAAAPEFRITLKKGNPHLQNNPKEDSMSDVDLNSIEVSSTVDARGSACPGPLLEAKKGIGKVRVGDILEIYSSDSGTRNDIPAWSKKVGHEYLGLLEADGYDKHFIRRKK